MTRVTGPNGNPVRFWMAPGQAMKIPGDRGSITFDGVERFAGLSVRHDPGKAVALFGSLAALAGLLASLTFRRRRIFVRVRPAVRSTPAAPTPTAAASAGATRARTVVSMGALAKSEDPGLAGALEHVLAAIKDQKGHSR